MSKFWLFVVWSLGRFQTVNSQKVGGAHLFLELKRPAQDASSQVKNLQEFIGY